MALLHGWFDHRGSPLVRVWLVIPSLRISASITMMVDTGADVVIIHPRDSIQIGVQFDRLEASALSATSGGVATGSLHRGFVAVAVDGFIHTYETAVLIAAPNDANTELPSLLGRSVLNRGSMAYSAPAGQLTIDLGAADSEIPL